MEKSLILSYYKRKDIQQAMIENAKDREIAIRFEKGFGKRPDILLYPDEVIQLAKQDATSFHASEELWTNPRMISSELKKSEMDNLRKGWDLILDIDIPNFQISKITAWLIIQTLKDFNIEAISIKFSGNKGFHIGVPFESFPKEYEGKETRLLFPEAARNLAAYILEYLSEKYISVKENNDILFGDGLKKRFRVSSEKLCKIMKKSFDELVTKNCSRCGREIKKNKIEENKVEFICHRCNSSIKENSDIQFKKCPKCNTLMDKKEIGSTSVCECGSNDQPITKFNPFSIIEVDTILISSRHLFRMPFSLHEKSSLCSLPFNPDKVLMFKKEFASPKIAKVSDNVFVDRKKSRKDEAKELFEKAMEFAKRKELREEENKRKDTRVFDELTEAIPETLFPPCITKMFSGLEDGKKRAIFILINFLKCVGWDYSSIEQKILDWNKKNPDPLRETIVRGQISYHKRNKDKILPPNCDNQGYYKDLQCCIPDNFCRKIKNPVNYSLLKAKNTQKKK